MKRGFTLVEVLVALVVLEVGLLGVVGTVVLASRVLAAAEDRERALAGASLLLDSLAAAEGSGVGRASGPWGEIEWSRDGGALVTLRVLPRGGRPWIVQGAGLPVGGWER